MLYVEYATIIEGLGYTLRIGAEKNSQALHGQKNIHCLHNYHIIWSLKTFASEFKKIEYCPWARVDVYRCCLDHMLTVNVELKCPRCK